MSAFILITRFLNSGPDFRLLKYSNVTGKHYCELLNPKYKFLKQCKLCIISL